MEGRGGRELVLVLVLLAEGRERSVGVDERTVTEVICEVRRKVNVRFGVPDSFSPLVGCEPGSGDVDGEVAAEAGLLDDARASTTNDESYVKSDPSTDFGPPAPAAESAAPPLTSPIRRGRFRSLERSRTGPSAGEDGFVVTGEDDEAVEAADVLAAGVVVRAGAAFAAPPPPPVPFRVVAVPAPAPPPVAVESAGEAVRLVMVAS